MLIISIKSNNIVASVNEVISHLVIQQTGFFIALIDSRIEVHRPATTKNASKKPNGFIEAFCSIHILLSIQKAILDMSH